MGTTKADLSTWLSYPQNQYGFANVDKILPTITISKSGRQTSLPRSPKKFDAFDLEHNGVKFDLDSFISETQTDGLIVLQNGKVVFEDYFNGNTKDSKHIVMSITKSVTGLLVGILQSRGKLSVDDLVSKYVPEISETSYKDKTIQQCIDMRSGVLYAEGQQEYRAAAGWHPLNGTEKHQTLKEFLSNFTPDGVTDDRFEYVSPNTDLMGWALERATGQSFAGLVQELIWQPMGAESDAFVTVDSSEFARAAGGLAMSLRDLARIAQLIANDGKNDQGEVVVPSDWLQDILHGGSKEAWKNGKFAPAFQGYFDNMAYRAYCYVDEESETIMGFGVFGQVFIADRKSNTVLVTTRSQDTPLDMNKIRMTLGAFKEFKRLLAHA